MTVGVTIKVANMREVIAEAVKLRGAGDAALLDVITDLTLATHKQAVRGIQRGPTSGRVYQKYNPRRTHKASAPGEYPQSDTGRLASGVMFDLPKPGPKPEGQVYTNIRYGKYLELKPASMGGRPWLLRAFNEATKTVLADLRKALAKKNKGSN